MQNLFYLQKEELEQKPRLNKYYDTDKNDDEFEFDFLEEVMLPCPNGKFKKANLMLFLHGYCDIFAYRLRDLFGYQICNEYEDENCEHLIHSYCKFNYEGKDYYIDIRGITDDYDEFRNEFADWDTNGYSDDTCDWFVDESKENLNRFGDFKNLHKRIDDIMACYKNEYDVIKWLQKQNATKLLS